MTTFHISQINRYLNTYFCIYQVMFVFFWATKWLNMNNPWRQPGVRLTLWSQALKGRNIVSFISHLTIIFSSFRAAKGRGASYPWLAPGVIHIWLFQRHFFPLNHLNFMSFRAEEPSECELTEGNLHRIRLYLCKRSFLYKEITICYQQPLEMYIKISFAGRLCPTGEGASKPFSLGEKWTALQRLNEFSRFPGF